MFADTANGVLPVAHIAGRAGIAQRLIHSCSDSRSGHHVAVAVVVVGDGDLPGAEHVRRSSRTSRRSRRSPGRARH
ncbi:hypothetical protein [Streptomyces sp. NPDC092307]|uniref:hypothetical protein n=1 Tax=Streptomyces sp. NPDC092307 TaxID=3366013 RepID=UPI00380BC0E1